jgi:hypothetical protein
MIGIKCLRSTLVKPRVAQAMLMGLPLLKRLISQTNPGTSVPPRDGEVPYIR